MHWNSSGFRVDKVGGVGVPVVKQDDRNGHSLAGQGAYGLVIGIHHRLVEVVGHPDREAAVVPLLFDVDHAHEPVAAGTDVLRALDQVAHRERGGELVAETLLDPCVQEMERFYPAVAEVHAALEPVRQVDVEFRGQREGRRAVYEIEVVMFSALCSFDALPLPECR